MSNEWEISRASWRDNCPHGAQIQDFIAQFPEWMVYVRKDPRFKCSLHYHPASESHTGFTTACSCMGFGTKVSLNLVPIHISRGRMAEISAIDGSTREFPGYLMNNQDVAHIPRAVYPQPNDFLIGCEWDKPTQSLDTNRGRVTRIHSIYMIKQINAQFQREVAFYSCGIDSLDFDLGKFQELIPLFSNLEILDLSWKQDNYW